MEAAEAAVRAQQADFDDQQEQQRTAEGSGTGKDGVVMKPSGDTLVDIDPKSDCVGTHTGSEIGCEIDLEFHLYGEMDFYTESCPLPGVDRAKCGQALQRDYLMSSPLDVRFRENDVHVDGVALTASVLKAVATAAVADIVGCWNRKISSCLWLVGSIVLPGVLWKAAEAAFAVRLAMRDGARLSTAIWGLRGSGMSASAAARLEQLGAEALMAKCFPPGTKVATEDGPKPIEEIEVGDRVWSLDQATGQQSLQRVLKLFHHTVDRLIRVRTADGHIEATDRHRFWARERGWVEARDLRAGDTFETQDGESEKVLGTSLVEGEVQVFNFEVEQTHTYYVYAGSVPVLVHNDCASAILDDLVRDGDHIVLGINPYSDNLAAQLGGRTFNAKKPFGDPHRSGDGRPVWMVAVEEALENPNVKLSISLDGVPDATNADEALALLVERGRPLIGADWRPAAQGGNGTAWEMATLRLKVLRGPRIWDDIEWYMTQKGEQVPSRVTPAKPDWAE
ncbi:Hedgehog/intein hint domain-containing protein [Actinobacteria bacterium OK074]|nr:Hedgehog/intein hint domain-containing protein [Actinobacteria bacterium OK074]